MKKLVSISLFIFWAAIAAILADGLVFYQNDKTVGLLNSIPTTGNSSSSTGKGASLVLNSAEVSKHNSLNDCWLIISNKIYNVTGFLNSHPGGKSLITPYCGKEATNTFNTQDRGTPHSSVADNLLTNYYIGDLNQTISQEQVQQNVQQADSTALPKNIGEEKDEEFEDD